MQQPIIILLVEDELPVRKLISEMLHGSGFTVVAASSGPDAIRAFAESREPVDLLLTDVELGGGMSGVELAERLEALRPGLKVVLMSGSRQQSMAYRYTTAFIRKPFLRSDLIQKLATALANRDGFHFRRDCTWIKHLLVQRYPRIQFDCEESSGTEYLIRLRLRPELPGKEVRVSVREYLDGRWEDKIAAAVDRLHAS